MGLYASTSRIIVSFLSLFLPYHYIKNVDILLKTLPRDIRLTYVALELVVHSIVQKYLKTNCISTFGYYVKKNPQKKCYLFEDEVWTFKDVNDYSNRVADLFYREGFRKGDVIALDATNRPEYACMWLGLAKIGVVTALINTNLRQKPLIHSIKAASCKAIIYTSDLAEAVNEVRSELDGDIRYYQLGPKNVADGSMFLDDALKESSTEEPPKIQIKESDHLMYIYTSGTTGLPKAAIMPHSRFLLVGLFGQHLLSIKEDDIIYNPLPLYHTAGGLLGQGVAMLLGCTVVIRKKFSASMYFEECAKYQCTAAQYIGEICRYILTVKEKPTDRQHKLRLIYGNGLRPAVWKAFVERFNIPNVRELYGSTEGNLQFANLDNKIGAVGAIPRFFPFTRYAGALIRVDKDTMEPIRGPNGLCMECGIDEPGMFVGLIPRKDTVKDFHGYLDKKESKKKFIYNVFKNGDKAFVSGDLIVMDELGYLYFKDRTGDTFRWKGENVATSEVEDLLAKSIGLRQCIVYGVEVGDCEGRAGMAAIVDPSGQVDLEKLAAFFDKMLPKYAHPKFIRMVPELELTGTFKPKKVTFSNEGFDPNVVEDPLFFRSGKTYVPITRDLYNKIISGEIQV